MLCVADACPESITLPQSCLSCYRQGGASGGVQRPDAVETQETVEETVAEPIEEALERLEEELKALQEEEEELNKVEDHDDRDWGRLHLIQKEIKTKEMGIEAKRGELQQVKRAAEEAKKAAEEEELKAAAEVAEAQRLADEADRQQKKRKEISGLEARRTSAANEKDYETAGKINTLVVAARCELAELEQPTTKRARSKLADT